MKRISLYIVTFLMVLFAGCSEDYLEVKPSDALRTDQAFQTLEDAQVALNGVYSALQSASYYNADLITYGDLKGTDVRSWANGKRADNQYLYQEEPEASNSGMWNQPYYGLMLANTILDQIDDMPAQTDEEIAERDHIKGQAMALRALFHFDLVRVYGNMPENGDPATDLGVPILDKVIDPESKPPRNTVKEVYDFVISDLETAADLMKDEQDNGVFNSYGAKALLSRVQLYYNNPSAALTLAEEVINSGLYSLIDTSSYVESFVTGSNDETIFEVVNTSNDNSDREGIGYLWEPTGYGALTLTNEMIGIMQENTGDVRAQLLAPDTRDGENNRLGHLLKYPGKTTSSRVFNVPVLRLSEMYLIAAEAAIKTTDMTTAQGYLNDLLEARTDVVDSLDVADVDMDVLMWERRKELVGEGHRFFDLVRNGMVIDRNGDDHLQNAPMLIDPQGTGENDFRVVQPIPRFELDVNPNLIQNEGYEG